jgi:iron complex outermembrane receptor protein
MNFPHHRLYMALALLSLGHTGFALETPSTQPKTIAKVHQLPALEVSATDASAADLVSASNVLNKEQLSQGATTLGEALKNQPGINSDTFGAGASRPVIRGQTAPRVKVLADGAEVSDASQISPDHAITVDPLLSRKVEVLRGPATLLYGGGAIGGVVNVLDEKIPSQLPEHGLSGELNLRGNTGSNEKAAAAALTVGLGEHLAVHAEGLSRDADDYQVASWQDKRVPGTYNSSENASIGLSWMTDQGYSGIAFTRLHNEYGLAGDADAYAICAPNSTGNRLICNGEQEQEEEGHSHHGDDVAWVKMDSKRVDLRSEYSQPFAGFSQLNFRGSYTDYQHAEIEDGEAKTTFKNQASNARVELTHLPIAGWTGVWGLQYQHSDFQAIGDEAFLPETLTNNYAVFALENYQWRDVNFEVGARHEWQRVDPSDTNSKFSQQRSDLHANSASVAANWQFRPDYYLGVSLAHAERLPNAQELYANGPHFATSTYEIGDQQLKAEKSNNIELSLKKTAGDFKFNLNVFHNSVDGYIYANTLDRVQLEGNTPFRLIQYTQKDAHFNGAEGQISYQLSPRYSATVFSDYVRAKLKDGGNLPRIPSARSGLRVDADFLDGIHGAVEYVHGFEQDHIASYETASDGYDLVNLNLSYDRNLNAQWSYQLYLQANNLLDQTYYNHSSYLSSIPQMGRNFTAGLRLRF